MIPLRIFQEKIPGLSNKNGTERIVAIGELLIDLVPASMDVRLSECGEIIKTVSGSSGIFACAISRLSGNAGFLGRVGVDSLSKMAVDTIRDQGVDLSRVIVSEEGQIGLAFIEYTDEGRHYQYYRKNSVGSHYSVQDLDAGYIEGAFAVHYSGMLLELTEDMRGACIRAAEIARENGVLVSFDPNIRPEMMKTPDARDRLLWAVRHADIIAPTLDEARFITGETEQGRILEKLHSMGPTVVALTRDCDGAILSCGGEVVYADGIDVEAIDPTGAGDAFAAALVYGIEQAYPLEKLAAFCNSVGALVTTRRGTIGVALPSLEEANQMMASGKCRVHG